MAAIDPAKRRETAKKASMVAVTAHRAAVAAYLAAHGPHIRACIQIASGAAQRCNNPNSGQYRDYGARGIEFRFTSVKNAGEWIAANLGPKPTSAHSLDRIDNNRHYEPGNLRWATRSEQARNKRAYKRGVVGGRIRSILEQRGDITYETARTWIAAGLTDEDILQRRKHARPSV